MNRQPEDVVNFAAGPSKLPKEVILESTKGAYNFQGTGIGVMELSHRSKTYAGIHTEAIETLRKLLHVPPNYKVLLLQGGGYLQFAAIPLNLTQSEEEVADYFVTGAWSQKAAKEASKYLKVNMVLPTMDKFVGVAKKSEWKLSDNASYVYYCDNETVHGVEFPEIPDVGDKLLVADMSSNIFTRLVDVSKFGLIYAGAQKNLGCSGVTIVIVREDLLGKPRKYCPSITDYTIQAGLNSLLNTPCTWATYILGLVLKWIEKNGGVPAMQDRSLKKSKLLYDTIAESQGFYSLPVEPENRSRTNVPFRLGTPENRDALETEFLKQAEERGLLQLKGHRSVGGIRASMYNAISVGDVELLVSFMREFSANNRVQHTYVQHNHI